MKAIITQGLPGSGKSSWVRELMVAPEWFNKRTVIAEADHFHMKGGKYKFDVKNASNAHLFCWQLFDDSCRERADLVACANTNTQLWEMSPYVMAAKASGYEVEFHTFECSVETSVRRNLHGVPRDVIVRMAERMEKPLPFWGKHTIHHT